MWSHFNQTFNRLLFFVYTIIVLLRSIISVNYTVDGLMALRSDTNTKHVTVGPESSFTLNQKNQM